MRNGYDPNQPRIPAGRSNGGQWVKENETVDANFAARKEAEKQKNSESIKQNGGHPSLSEKEKADLPAFVAGEIGVSVDDAEDIISSIFEYTVDYYVDVREYQSEGTGDARIKNISENIEFYIQRAEPYKGTIYRGMAVGSSYFDSLKIGKHVNMKGTSSWSSDEYVAKDFAYNRDGEKKIIFVTNSPEKSASIKHLSDYEEESEVLVSKDVSFIVKDIKKKKRLYGDDIYYITLEEKEK